MVWFFSYSGFQPARFRLAIFLLETDNWKKCGSFFFNENSDFLILCLFQKMELFKRNDYSGSCQHCTYSILQRLFLFAISLDLKTFYNVNTEEDLPKPNLVS